LAAIQGHLPPSECHIIITQPRGFKFNVAHVANFGTNVYDLLSIDNNNDKPAAEIPQTRGTIINKYF